MKDMFDPTFLPALIVATSIVVSLAIVCHASLKGWRAWLDLKRRELDRIGAGDGTRRTATSEGTNLGAARIEISDLKERIRKLEAIASGVDP